MLLQEGLYFVPHLHPAQGALALDPGVKRGRDVYGEPGRLDASFFVSLFSLAGYPVVRGYGLPALGLRSESYLLGHCSISSINSVVMASISLLARLPGSTSKTVCPRPALSAQPPPSHPRGFTTGGQCSRSARS